MKSFTKQTRTIDVQVEKQIKTLEKKRKQLVMPSSEKDALELLKQEISF